MRVIKGLIIVLFAIAVISCASEQDTRVYSFSYIFTDSASGWSGDFADYPVNSTGYDLETKLDTLPFNINTDSTKKGILISGNSSQDSVNEDLFMFIKRKVSGLGKNKAYKLLFNVRFASNAPTGETDEGYSPGDSVYLKVGAATTEPTVSVTDDYYRLSIDNGFQEGGSSNVITLGTTGVAATTETYALISRFNTTVNSNLVITSNAEGELWVIVGTDSGFKGVTTLYYTQVNLVLNEVD